MKIATKKLKRIIREELAKESRDGRMLPSQVVKKPAPYGYDRAGFPRTEPDPDAANETADAVKGLESAVIAMLKAYGKEETIAELYDLAMDIKTGKIQ